MWLVLFAKSTKKFAICKRKRAFLWVKFGLKILLRVKELTLCNSVHHLLDLVPSSEVESLDPPVVEGGPLVTADKGKADKEDQEVD